MTTTPASSVTSGVLPAEMVRITVDPSTEPFWLAARDRRLVACRCGSCGQFRMPPTPFCPNCQSTDIDWPELSGAAEVFSFSVVHGYPGIPDLTLVAAVVDLPDARPARLVTNVVGVDPATVHIGMALTVDFSPIAGDWLLPVFRPVQP